MYPFVHCSQRAGHTYQGAKNSTRAGFPELTMSSKLEGVRSITLLARTVFATRATDKKTEDGRILRVVEAGIASEMEMKSCVAV